MENSAMEKGQDKQVKPSTGDANSGVQAITPYPVIAIENAPRFTESDVRAYLEHFDTAAFVGSTVSGESFTIRKIQFMTNKEVFTLTHGHNPDLADDGVVCVAELYGPFYMTAISVPPGRKPLPPMDVIGIVFDGQTGNIIMTWEYNDAK
jgi:hypothetical protein